MEPSSVLAKTAKGIEEIDKRTHKLAGRLRAVLIMIDGHRTLEELLEQAGGLASQLAEQLDELVAGGYIHELTPHEEVGEVVQPAVPKPRQETAAPRAQAPTAPAAAAPKKAGSPPWTAFPIGNLKARLSKMVTETMGMRAMFVAAQLDAVSSHTELESLIDDIARTIATSNGPDAASKWREQARHTIGIA
jgi:DNA-binding FrmR family transcriptional regulator